MGGTTARMRCDHATLCTPPSLSRCDVMGGTTARMRCDHATLCTPPSLTQKPPPLFQIVLVKSYGKRGCWGFPKGKVNKDELPLECAIREVRILVPTRARARAVPRTAMQVHLWIKQTCIARGAAGGACVRICAAVRGSLATAAVHCVLTVAPP